MIGASFKEKGQSSWLNPQKLLPQELNALPMLNETLLTGSGPQLPSCWTDSLREGETLKTIGNNKTEQKHR